MNSREIRNASFFLDFTFVSQEDEKIVFAKGYQQIVFADKSHKPTRLPFEIIEKIRQYSMDS